MRVIPQFRLRQLLASILVICVLLAFSASNPIGLPLMIGIGSALVMRQLASGIGRYWLWLWSVSFVGATLSTSLFLAVVIQRMQPPAVDPGIILIQMVIIGVVIATVVELFLLAFRSLG